ncbi:unnamed protein product [Miscanthus lutarioriparius]|uniref:Uncharacterized protein n=1 Tax=Miscanthus lutarioriparius TaxID=422564 RepID=A0A811P319_9POAL|nr:unnamed protein product [Miscanthus lutarioriparius]
MDGKKVKERAAWGTSDGGGNLVKDAVDYRGCRADKSSTGGWVAAALALGIELCERLSTMGIAVNLVTYLTGTMHLPSAAAANVVTDFMGTSFLLCLLGGFLADSFLGRYLTIAIFALVQAIVSTPVCMQCKLDCCSGMAR